MDSNPIHMIVLKSDLDLGEGAGGEGDSCENETCLGKS